MCIKDLAPCLDLERQVQYCQKCCAVEKRHAAQPLTRRRGSLSMNYSGQPEVHVIVLI